MRWVAVGLLVVLAAGVGLWWRAAQGVLARIEAVSAALDEVPVGVPRRDLPAPVTAFAQQGLLGGEALSRSAQFRQEAAFRQVRGGPFRSLRATHTVGAGATGFVWVAEQTLGPLPLVRVVDRFVDGQGELKVRLLGVIPVAAADGPDIDRAEAMRYLAELPWAPDAILGNAALEWQAVDDRTVEVSVPTNGGLARVTLHFDGAGDIARITAKDRPAEPGPDGRPVLRDWEGRFWNYGVLGDRRVPLNAEVGYIYKTGYEAYFKARVTDYRLGP